MRIKVFKFIYFSFIFLILLRLFYWQVLKSDELLAMAEDQRLSSREVLAPRGNIFFTDGSTLASTQPIFLVFAQPKVIAEKKETAEILADIFWEAANFENFSTDEKKIQIKEIYDDLFLRLNKDLFWVSLGRKVSVETKERIEKLGLKGIGFDVTTGRFYPEGSSSAQLLGFVGSDIYGNETGYFGIEGFYNGELKGKNGNQILENDALGLPILIGDFLSREAKPGKNLTLTLDRTVQYIVEEKLKKGLEKYQAKGVSALVLNPKTGEVLAMASLPNYDPSTPFRYPKETYRNPLIVDGYEPGSTFKVLIMAAGINEEVVKDDTKCDICSGPIKIGEYSIKTWNEKYQADSTMTDVVVHSDNTGMVFVGRKLGLDKLYYYLEEFGFGSLTNIDLQDEYSPDLREKKDWKEIDLATASFGQGIAITGMQMVKAVASIANGGKIMEPYIVKKIEDENGVVEIKPKEKNQPIKEETAKKITEMMVKAVDLGESKRYKPEGFKVAGKTGTAQIPVAGHYDPDKTIASFIGFAPVDDPKFIMLIRYLEPSSSIFGSETAAPTFFEIAKELFTYYGISPSE